MRRLPSITFVLVKWQVFYSLKIGPSINQLISGEMGPGWGDPFKYFYNGKFPTGTDGLIAPEIKRLTLLKLAYHGRILSSSTRNSGL